MTEFRAKHGQSSPTIETELFDVEVNQSVNPFGDFAILYIDDNSGNRFDDYERGTQIIVEEKDFSQSNSAFSEYFTGYVVERRELNRQSGDVLEVEAYTFDQFLRRNVVGNDQSGNSITTALDNVITNDTPVTHLSSNVTVLDDQTLTRGFRGENVETFLRAMSKLSGNESWGVNEALEFFFRQNETDTAPRDIDNTQWVDYDIPERGKRSVNQVRVFFNSGSEAITLEDASAQLDLQDKLGANSGIELYEEVSRPDITNRGPAVDVAERILQDKSPTLTGTVTTFGLPRAEPGDTIDITIEPRGVDGEFRIADNLTTWSSDTNKLTIVEKRGNQDELLSELARDTKRVEMRDADRTITPELIIPPTVGATVEFGPGVITSSAGGSTTINNAVITNDGFQALRSGWLGNVVAPWNVAGMQAGSKQTRPSRTDTTLGNLQDTDTGVTVTRPSNTTVNFEGTDFDNSVTLTEFSLQATNGDMLCRGTFDGLSGSTVDISFDLTIENDPNIARGVITDQGQQVLAGVLEAAGPNKATDYAFGDGTSDVSQNDTSLSNSATDSIDNRIPTGERQGLFQTDFDTTITGKTISESGALDTNSNLLTRARFVSRTVGGSQPVVARETARFRNK